ncbi:MAG TPA: heavy metal-binding domain-containing protein, partial [Candidatus Udaeobacter sp.]|nr:heavy metal-binding domain-containing protein [Candidatus Udaeobacter sp.]
MKQFFHNPVFRLATVVLLLAITPACSKRDGGGGRDSNVDYWTCTMHPSVHAKDPGKCPICSMDLVPVMKRAGGASSPTPAATPTNQSSAKGDEMKGMQGMGNMPG